MAFCTKCGAQMGDGSYCTSCGAKADEGAQAPNVVAAPTQTQMGVGNDDTELMRAFIGPESSYYLEKFSMMPTQNDFAPTWNWPGFLFGLWWLLYRKMYIYAALAWVGTIVLSSITAGAGGIVAMVLIGVFANSLYRKFVREEIAKTAGYDDVTRRQMLATKGGVTWIPVIIATVACVLIGIVVFAIFGALLFSLGAASY